MTVQAGEFICVMGSNGAGKTTLLKILAGLVLPTDGTARVEGRDVAAHRAALRARIGYAAGEPPGFYDVLTGRQNLLFFAALYGLRGQAAARRVDSLCERLGVEAPEQRYQECSAGMKQRLALARTLVHDPPVLLLDEPLRSLDPIRVERLQDLLKQELSGRMGKTILLTTHRAGEAERLADRVVILHRGALKGCGSVAELAGGGSLEAAIRERCAT